MSTPTTYTLAKGETYDIKYIDFAGWTKGDGTGHEGYNVASYFHNGVYLGADKHGIEPTVYFCALDYAAAILSAIQRSVSHNEIARVSVPSFGHEDAIDYLENQEEIEDLDSACENDGSLDVWGKYRDEDFRIRLINTGA